MRKFDNNIILKTRFIIALCLVFITAPLMSSGVLQNGADGKWNMCAFGAYDVKMISAPVLHPVWIKSAEGAPYVVDTIITDSLMLCAGDKLSQNNRYGDNTNCNGITTASEVSNKQPWLDAIATRPAGTQGTALVYADCDDDMSTFQSSAAYLDFGSYNGCTKIYKAYLYWSGVDGNGGTTSYAPYNGMPTMKSHNGGATGTTAGGVNQKVLFKAPGMTSYSEVSASQGYDVRLVSADHRYAYKADVTDLVKGKGNGLYWVANVRSASALGTSGGASGAWTLLVIFQPPNCPYRTIKIWDTDGGNYGVQIPYGEGEPIQFTFDNGEVPATGNSISYVGFIALDAEDDAAGLTQDYPDPIQQKAKALEGALKFDGGTGVLTVQPFVDGSQPTSHACSDAGVCLDEAYWGICSSQTTTWDDEKQTNGNQITRLPDNRILCGYDAHHLRLPYGAIAPGASQATLTLPQDISSGTLSSPMAYVAIQTLQSNLVLTKSAQSLTTAPDNILTYQLSTKNIGSLVSKLGAYILDTLDKTIDFVPSSVQILDKNGAALSSVLNVDYTIQNQGADVNEVLRFNLPQIQAGDGINANDSVTIKFQVKVKGKDRMDIWGYGFNRQVKNRASLTYTADNGDQIVAGSNSGASCDGASAYYLTPIVDAEIDSIYKATHILSDTITEELLAATQAGQKMYIEATFRAEIAAQLSLLGLDPAEASMYTIYNHDTYAKVSSTDYFTDDNFIQKYYAIADYGNGLDETFYITYFLASIPSFELIGAVAPSCSSSSDGVVTIEVKNGSSSSYSLLLRNSAADTAYYAWATGDPALFRVEGLKQGTYSVVAGDVGSMPATGTVVVPNASPMSVSLSPKNPTICEGNGTTLTASGALGTAFVWVKAEWNEVLSTWGAYDTITNNSATLVVPSLTKTTKYKVFTCNGYCQEKDSTVVTVNTKPVVELHPVDTTVSISVTPTVPLKLTQKAGEELKSWVWEMAESTSSAYKPIGSASYGIHTKINDSTYIISAIDTIMDGYVYKVTVSDGVCNPVVSNVSKLHVVKGVAVDLIKGVDGLDEWSIYTSCPGVSDGEFNFSLSAGDQPGLSYSVKMYAGNYSSVNEATVNGAPIVYSSPTNYVFSTSAVTYNTPDTLSAGAYTLIVEPIGTTSYDPTIKHFNVVSPEPMNAVVSGADKVCMNTISVELTTSISGGKGDPSNYQWYWERSYTGEAPYDKVNANSYIYSTGKLTKDAYYRVVAYEIGSEACAVTSDDHYIEALPTPIAAVRSTADLITGCYKYDLHNLPVYEQKGLTAYDVSLHYEDPGTDASDNSTLIDEADYFVKKPMTVYARLSLGGICATSAAASIKIRKMEDCYPITIPEFFSPDGDGINDLFQIDGLDEYDSPKIKIFDRYGKKVFDGSKEDLLAPNGWDGKYVGKDLPSGDYWYEMTFTELKPKVGHFSIKRRKE